MTAVIYARYSSDNQREESIEGQIRECTAYAEKNGITIVKHYIDRAISAKTDNRPVDCSLCGRNIPAVQRWPDHAGNSGLAERKERQEPAWRADDLQHHSAYLQL